MNNKLCLNVMGEEWKRTLETSALVPSSLFTVHSFRSSFHSNIESYNTTFSCIWRESHLHHLAQTHMKLHLNQDTALYQKPTPCALLLSKGKLFKNCEEWWRERRQNYIDAAAAIIVGSLSHISYIHPTCSLSSFHSDSSHFITWWEGDKQH